MWYPLSVKYTTHIMYATDTNTHVHMYLIVSHELLLKIDSLFYFKERSVLLRSL